MGCHVCEGANMHNSGSAQFCEGAHDKGAWDTQEEGGVAGPTCPGLLPAYGPAPSSFATRAQTSKALASTLPST